MNIPKEAHVAIAVKRDWANLYGVRKFLHHGQEPEQESRGSADSLLVFAKVLDADDSHGIWVQLNTDRMQEDPSVKRLSLLIPWPEVLAIVLAEDFSADVWEQARKFGYKAD